MTARIPPREDSPLPLRAAPVGRQPFERAKRMGDEAVGIVERMTAPRVRAYLSDVDPEEALAMHFFVFETRPESGTTAVAEVAADEAAPEDR